MMEEDPTMASASPESIPSLDLSQASTYSTEEEESPDKQDVTNDFRTRGNHQYHAMFDIEEEDNISDSSGILSTQSLDLSFDNSIHSFASMETIKRQHSKEPLQTGPAFTNVEPEDIPANRACHSSALNITPRQLGEVFSFFSNERTKASEGQWPPPVAPEIESKWPVQPLGIPSQMKAAVSTDPIPAITVASKSVRFMEGNSSGTSKDTRATENVPSTQQRRSGELLWKPRAKSLEKECAALKEIIRVDSENIVKLKTALETLGESGSRYLGEIQSLKKRLNSTTRDLGILRREHEILQERETEHLETIKILKHEVDILTRDGKAPSKKDVDTDSGDHPEQDELRLLRLENQMFASQIVGYETELQCLSVMEKEQEQLQQQVDSLRSKIDAFSDDDERSFEEKDPEEEWHVDCVETSVVDREDQAVAGAACAAKKRFSFYNAGDREMDASCEVPVLTSIDGSQMRSDVETQSSESDENYSRLFEEIWAEDGTVSEEKEMELDTWSTQEQECSEEIDNHVYSQPETDRPGGILAEFSLQSHMPEEGKESEQKIYVIQEHELSSEPSVKDEIKFLQWQTPESLPTFVRMENITLEASDTEERDPPSTSSLEKTNMDVKQKRNGFSIRDVLKRHHQEEDYPLRQDTEIDVLETSDNSVAIEVQLSCKKNNNDDNKENESQTKPYLCSGGCEDNCDAWSAISECLVFSSNKAQ